MSWSVLIFVIVAQFVVLWWPNGHKLSERGPRKSSLPGEIFWGFVFACSELWTWYLAYTSARCYDSSSLRFIVIRSLDPFTTKKMVKLVSLQMASSFGPFWFLLQMGIFWPWWPNTHKGESLVRSPWFPASEEFPKFFSICFEVSTWMLVYTLSRLHNLLTSCFTRIGSMWPNPCY